ncbi:hypothetical protein ACUTFJ_13560, partial [Klebsiella pneumoniae]
SAQIREILISESAWEEMTCLFAPSLNLTDKRTTFKAQKNTEEKQDFFYWMINNTFNLMDT